MANFCELLWCIVNDLSFLSKFINEEQLSLYTIILRDLSWRLLMQLFNVLLWNIQIKGQYPNWDSINAFIILFNLSVVIKWETLAIAWSLWQTFFTYFGNMIVEIQFVVYVNAKKFYYLATLNSVVSYCCCSIITIGYNEMILIFIWFHVIGTELVYNIVGTFF